MRKVKVSECLSVSGVTRCDRGGWSAFTPGRGRTMSGITRTKTVVTTLPDGTTTVEATVSGGADEQEATISVSAEGDVVGGGSGRANVSDTRQPQTLVDLGAPPSSCYSAPSSAAEFSRALPRTRACRTMASRRRCRQTPRSVAST
jgi:hypothetical protein